MHSIFAARHVFILLFFTILVASTSAQNIVVTDENQVRYTNGIGASQFPVSIYPDTQVGVSKSLTYRIHNDSPLPLTITNIQTLSPAAVVTGYDPPASLSIEPFGTTYATLRARPDALGTFNIQVTIQSNSVTDSTFVLNLSITATDLPIAEPDLDMKFFTNTRAKYNAKRNMIDLKVTGLATNVGNVITADDMVVIFRTSKRYLDDTATLLGVVPVKNLKLPKKPGKPPKSKKVKFKGSTEINQGTIYLALFPGTTDDGDWSNNVANMFYTVTVP